MSLQTLFPDEDRRPRNIQLPRDDRGRVKWEAAFAPVSWKTSVIIPLGNNTWATHYGRTIALVLYETTILTVNANGGFQLSKIIANKSHLTRKRLNEYLPYDCRVWKGGLIAPWYLKTPKGVTPLSDQNTWWYSTGRGDLSAAVNACDHLELEKKVRSYAREYVRALLQGKLFYKPRLPYRYCAECARPYGTSSREHSLLHLQETAMFPGDFIAGAARAIGQEKLAALAECCVEGQLEKDEQERRRVRRDPEKIIERMETQLRFGRKPPAKKYPRDFRKDFEDLLLNHLIWSLNCEGGDCPT